MNERQFYGAELYFLEDSELLSPDELMQVAVASVWGFCRWYRAELLHPVDGLEKSAWKHEGALPEDVALGAGWVTELIEWARANSFTDSAETLSLHLLATPSQENYEAIAQFHEGPSVNWTLYLTAKQYETVQSHWVAKGLPDNLYNDDEPICVPIEGDKFRHVFGRKLGFQKCYSPMQWAEINKDAG